MPARIQLGFRCAQNYFAVQQEQFGKHENDLKSLAQVHSFVYRTILVGKKSFHRSHFYIINTIFLKLSFSNFLPGKILARGILLYRLNLVFRIADTSKLTPENNMETSQISVARFKFN
jgi:hypothetical protein